MQIRSTARMMGLYLLIGLLLIACKKEDSPVVDIPKPPTNGEVRSDKKGIKQVWISPGSFLMGTSDSSIADIIAHRPPSWVVNELPSEGPQHEVRLTAGYWIDKYEATNEAFQAFVIDSGYYKMQYWSQNGKLWLGTQSAGKLPVTTGTEVSTHPRVNITWYEAEAYAAWRGGLLPTEAEWEYAARGPASFVYPWGNTFESLNANLIDNNSLTPVGSYPNGVSWVGVYDLAGNAMEWVQDWLDVDYYKQKVRDDPQGPTIGSVKIEKGGWWGSNQFVGRSAYRHFEDPPTYGDQHIGFRIVSKVE
jgi:formylglycine-generating enzyme required for sulfatase activity